MVPGGTASTAGADERVVVIELDGVEPGDGTHPRIEVLPGVLSCAAAATGAGTGAGARRATVRVSARESDAMLRRVLSWEGVHVAAVRDENAAGRDAAGRDAERAAADAEEGGW